MTYVQTARKKWPTAEWIIGSGAYASVSICPPAPTVMLFSSRAEADIAKQQIDATGCSGQCMGRHIVQKVQP